MTDVGTFTIQIINERDQENFFIEKLEWVKKFERDLQKYYDDIKLNTLEILHVSNVLHLDADLYIKPISMLEINVGFNVRTYFMDSPGSTVHWVNITDDESNSKIDVLSKFLMLVLGVICIPCATGCYHTDKVDLFAALGYGNTARIVELGNIVCLTSPNSISAIAWTNFHGEFQTNFNQTCNQLLTHIHHGNFSIVNPTCHPGLQVTSLALLINISKRLDSINIASLAS